MGKRQVQAEGSSRALFNFLKGKYPGKVITDSYLFLIKSIQGTTSYVQFDVLANVGTPFSTEVRLGITDRFVVRDWAGFLMKTGSSAVTTPTAAEMAVAKPLTYNNPAVFTGGSEAVNLEAIYNSSLKVVIDSEVYYQTFPFRNFYRVPVSQKGTTTAATSIPSSFTLATDGWDNMNYAFSPVTPNFEYSGIGKNEVNLTLPAPINTAGTASFNTVGLMLRGFLIQNINQRA